MMRHIQSTLTIENNAFVVLDLDDTLYKEIDYLISAFRAISYELDSQNADNLYHFMLQQHTLGHDVFGQLIAEYHLQISKKELLEKYRMHLPSISMDPFAKQFIAIAKAKEIGLGLITDGRSTTQRNKIQALGLLDTFDDVIISEEFGYAKPNPENFLYFQRKYPNISCFYYIADNFSKDFIAPNALNWITIAILDNGKNIHPQDPNLNNAYLPHFCVENFSYLLID